MEAGRINKVCVLLLCVYVCLCRSRWREASVVWRDSVPAPTAER